MRLMNKPHIKFYIGIILFLAINSLSYSITIGFIINGDHNSFGDFSPFIYLISMVAIPVSAYRMLRSAKKEFDSDYMNSCALITPTIAVFLLLSFGIRDIPIIMMFITVYGWGWIPMSWYNFREKRWEEK